MYVRASPGKKTFKVKDSHSSLLFNCVGRSLWNQQESLYQLSTALGLDMGNPGKSLPVSTPWLAVLRKMAVCALESILMPIIQMKLSE